MDRLPDLRQLYDLLARLEKRLGGTRRLKDCHGRLSWPKRGVYFFFEDGEQRTDTGSGPRVVRVGTHALTAKSTSTLWGRLSQHRGVGRTGGGNHRGSIFRLLVGTALKRRDGRQDPRSWGMKGHATAAAVELALDRATVKSSEAGLETEVSKHIGRMPCLFVTVDDEPGPQSVRALIERSAIALLSNFDRSAIDPPSAKWLGRYSDRPLVRESGLWNNNHVNESWDSAFLGVLSHFIDRTQPAREL